MNLLLRYTVDNECDGKAVKFVLKNKLSLSERLIKKLKYAGKILVNGSRCHVNVLLKTGDIVEANIDFIEEDDDITPQEIPLDIVYEDEGLIVINKGPGMVVHPTALHQSGTVANALKHHFISKGCFCKIRPVSRLDKDTSGLIVFAKNQFVQESLIRQMQSKVFIKKYKGIVNGIVMPPEGIIDFPIERIPGSIMLRQISPSGAPSLTRYNVIEYLDNASLLEFLLETGRTHQIRVHCQAIGHPILGDSLYGNNETDIIKRQALHSFLISFRHPLNGETYQFKSDFPEDIKHALEILRK